MTIRTVLIWSGQLVELLGVTTSHVSRLARQGVLKPANMTLGGHYRWDVQQLQADTLIRAMPLRSGNRQVRDRVVRLASALGTSNDEIGFAVGLTRARVYQISERADKRSRAVAIRWINEAAEKGTRERDDAVRLARAVGVSKAVLVAAAGISYGRLERILADSPS